jgi:hypothetical protein
MLGSVDIGIPMAGATCGTPDTGGTGRSTAPPGWDRATTDTATTPDIGADNFGSTDKIHTENFLPCVYGVTRRTHMEEDVRSDAQYDPKNRQPATAKRIRFSFVMVLLLFIALGLTAVYIATGPH